MKFFTKLIIGECPVCFDTKELKLFRNQNIFCKYISKAPCNHRICHNCKIQINKNNNPSCPLCRYKKPIASFNDYEKRMRTNFGRRRIIPRA